ncbi:hypothetical protein HYU93_01385 [Candidatus Daviesbacteria bacterium]|nr:hypothetical protein [Candidatus Daviesbacteria bacterium]
MSKKAFFLLIVLLIQPELFLQRVSADAGNCLPIEQVPPALVQNVAPISSSSPGWVQFKIIPKDTKSTYKLVFPSGKVGGIGSIERDNLTSRPVDGTLVDETLTDGPVFPGIYYDGGSLFEPGDHTFYLERKGSPGNYCKGKYTIKKDESGGITACVINFSTLTPNETDKIEVTGYIQPPPQSTILINQGYKLKIEGPSKLDVVITVDPTGNFKSTPLGPTGKLNPGNYTITLYKTQSPVGAITPNISEFVTNCKYNMNVASSGSPGSITQPGTPGTTGSSTACAKDDPKCSSGGGKLVSGCNNPKDLNFDPNNPAIATAIGCIHTNPAEFVKDLMKFIIGIGGGLAFLMMLLGAFQMLTSQGNPETLNAGRERLTSAVIGLLFIIFSILFLQIIGFGILAIPGFGP